MTTLREFFSLPMTSGERDRQVAVDELGRPVYATPMGDQYAMTEEQPQSFSDAVSQFTGQAVDDPLGTIGTVASAIAQGAWNGVEAPGNALRGEPITYGDVADTALDWGGMSAVGTAPRGAIRSGALRSADDVANVSVSDRGGGLFGVDVDGVNAGNITLARSGNFVSSADLLPEFQGRRIGPQAYDAIQRMTGRNLGPSPLGLSANARPFWRRRLAAMSPEDRASAIRQSYQEGIALGVPERDVRLRLYDVAGGEGLDLLDTPAQTVARLLREGRAGEVTDDMLGALTPNDNVELARLYDEGLTGQPMPMDEASRMARAQEMGFDTDAFHATRATEDFAAFRPGARGSVYMAATPDGAMRGAAGQALENPYAASGSQSVTAFLPLNVRSGDIDGLGVNSESWRALPEVVDGDEALRALQPQIEGVGAQYWDDVYLSQPRGDEFRYYRNDPPVVSYADLEPGRDVFGYRLPSWNSGSDVPSLNARAERGRSGFLVSDEAGSSIVASPTMPIRSRFARFDPRLSHLANLSAGAVGAGVALPYLSDDERGDTLSALRSYMERVQ